MDYRNFLIFLGILIFTPFALCAEEKIVTVSVAPVQEIFEAGKTYDIGFEIGILQPYHINNEKPLAEEYIPTKLNFTNTNGLLIESVAYPEAKLAILAGGDEQMLVWDGEIIINAKLLVPKGTKPGIYKVEANLFYQACDDTICHMPTHEDFSFMITVE